MPGPRLEWGRPWLYWVTPFGQDPAQVFLTQWDHEVQALTTYSAHQPFAVGIRLRCARGRAQHAQPKCFELVVYLYRKDGVAVANKNAVGPHRTRGNIDAELHRQLGGHASLPRGRILQRHPDDELA